ncbi:MAG: energy transducer TonB [Bacteroidota bacterium]|nr:energy transducer TonB [Bacteroidota bacterium]MDP4233290.1 energy transducer TonB [Bacteroidota bacterium]MDP4242090.1 energy transducer TonB [Bacteroidota bacterium]MDP4288631.1 energy transducer TonB [Bacteroidota bacterium]
MALSNLVVEKLEQYGGIDLKRNQQKYFSNALGISIGIHLIVILLYIGWSWFSNDEKRVPHIRIHSIAELAPPPSTENQEEMQPVTPPPPSDVVRPSLGIPVPVPDAIAPQLTLPNMNEPAPQAAVQSNGPVQAAPDLHINQPVEEAEPSKDEFIDVSQEPEPITPIEKQIQYPEVAKRSGLEGKVVVQALIAKDGHVEKAEVLKSDYDVFKQPAIDAMLKAKFTPARQNGTPLRIWITRTIIFKLR